MNNFSLGGVISYLFLKTGLEITSLFLLLAFRIDGLKLHLREQKRNIQIMVGAAINCVWCGAFWVTAGGLKECMDALRVCVCSQTR